MRKQRCGIGLEAEEEFGFKQINLCRKGKSVVKGDPKKSWSGIEVEREK